MTSKPASQADLTLIRGAIAANRGERSDAPAWICARIVS